MAFEIPESTVLGINVSDVINSNSVDPFLGSKLGIRRCEHVHEILFNYHLPSNFAICTLLYLIWLKKLQKSVGVEKHFAPHLLALVSFLGSAI